MSNRFAVVLGDAMGMLSKLPDNSVHLCVTDPPYFIDSMGDDWKANRIADHRTEKQAVKSLPSGMKFDPEQGHKLQAFMTPIAREVLRVLKPGGFFVCFSQARLTHRMGVAIEDAGFELRDLFFWGYESGQAKAFSQDHFVRRMNISDDEKVALIAELGGRKTPQVKPMIEPMVFAQKPREGTFIENWLAHKTGLIDTSVSVDGKFPGQLMMVPKPSKSEKGEFNDHPTVKPTPLIDVLVRMLSLPDQAVIDPFAGSGSHGVATLNAGRNFIGAEINPHYHDIAVRRLGAATEMKEAA
jgi:DNA modification methylase